MSNPRTSSPSGRAKQDGFPYKQLSVLAICRLAEPIAFNSISSYSFLMVQDIKGKDNASFYAGLLVSAFALAEACTAFWWGQLSDRYGRKPIILIALGGTALSSLLFGFAKNYWLALFARAVGGLLNGNVAVMQTMVAEVVTRPEHEPRAYALQPFMWSVGSVAGAALGGFAARPALSYPSLFSQDGLFGRFPYLLPNLIAVAIILLAMLQGYLFLQESNPAFIKRRTDNSSTTGITTDEAAPLLQQTTADSISKPKPRRRNSSFVACTVPLPHDPQFDLRRPSIVSIGSVRAILKDMPTTEVYPVIEEVEDIEEIGQRPIKAFTTSVIGWIIALILLCFNQMAVSADLPVYLLDKPRRPPGELDLVGGLGKDLPEVGSYLAVQSVISLTIQALVYPVVVDKLGVWRTVVFATVMYPFVLTAMPFVSLQHDPRIAVYIVMALQSFASIMLYPSLLIMLKNATPSLSVLGKVNGLAMSASSGARMASPPIVGIIYSKIGSAASWWLATIIALLAAFQLCFLRPEEDNKEIMRRASVAVEQ